MGWPACSWKGKEKVLMSFHNFCFPLIFSAPDKLPWRSASNAGWPMSWPRWGPPIATSRRRPSTTTARTGNGHGRWMGNGHLFISGKVLTIPRAKFLDAASQKFAVINWILWNGLSGRRGCWLIWCKLGSFKNLLLGRVLRPVRNNKSSVLFRKELRAMGFLCWYNILKQYARTKPMSRVVWIEL